LVTSQTFIDVDGGLESVLDYPLPFTDTPGEAQRLANIALERNRSQLTLNGDFGLKAFELQVGDFVSLSNTRLGFSNKVFEVVNWGFGLADGKDLITNLTLRETTSTTFNEVQDTAFESDNTTLPGVLGPIVIPGSGDVNSTTNVTGLTASGGVREIYVNWTNPINNNFSYTKIYYDTDSGIGGASQQNVTGESFVLSGLSANDQRYFWAQAYDTSNNTLGSLVGPVDATVKDITTGDIENNAITSALIAAGAVDTGEVTNFAITTAKIQQDDISFTQFDSFENFNPADGVTVSKTAQVTLPTPPTGGTNRVTATAFFSVLGAPTAGTDAALMTLEINNVEQERWISNVSEDNTFGGITLIGSRTINASGTYNVDATIRLTGYSYLGGRPQVDIYIVTTVTKTEAA
jgi:hypothetical protein